MQSRRSMFKTWARWLTVATLPTAAIFAATASGGVPRGPVLEDRLLLGLRVKTDADRKFIANVVELVERRVLPIKLVDTTYFWARAKASKRRNLANNPMVYFRPALIARAARLGIRI